MKVIKKIMCSLAVIASLATLNNLTMSMQRAAQDFIGRIAETAGRSLNQGDLEYIRSMLATYPGLANTRLEDGTTLLIKEIKLGEQEVVQLLLQDPATDISIADLEGNTPLHHFVSPPIGIEGQVWIDMYLNSLMKKIIPLALARGASPFVHNKKGEPVLGIVKWDYPLIYMELDKYARYARLLYESARKGNLSGVHYALAKGHVSVNMKNNDLLGDLPASEIGNTPFHAAILGALDRYNEILPEINRINELRNVGANKLVPASHFDKQIRKLLAPIDNMLRLIKISNPDTAIRNDKGETVGDLLSRATTEHVKTWPMLFGILSESREQSMDALRRAKLIG